MTQDEKDTQIGRVVREHGEAVAELRAVEVKIGRCVQALRVAANALDDLTFGRKQETPVDRTLAGVAGASELKALHAEFTNARERVNALKNQRDLLGV
ncbi:MAG TPA: hypothetical protein VMU84_00955 [Thermoanaerobaculia bacterium]|nr:hypothetical protein [Thermoanaerobaculia bacterium]